MTINGEPDVLSGLLRRYLLELPEPLVPVTHYKTLLSMLTSSKKFKSGKDKGGVAAVKEVVEASDFSRVHFHALRRVCGLMRMMLNSWWSDSGEAKQVLDIMAVNIMRPDNLNRSVASQKEMTSIKEAVANLISHSNSIFVPSTSSSDSNARRVSMIRKGERASRLQLLVDGADISNLGSDGRGGALGSANGSDGRPDSTRARRLSNVNAAETPRYDMELRQEFKNFREHTYTQVAELHALVRSLQLEIAELRTTRHKNTRSTSAETSSHSKLTSKNNSSTATSATLHKEDGDDDYSSGNDSEFGDCETPPSTPLANGVPRNDSKGKVSSTSVPSLNIAASANHSSSHSIAAKDSHTNNTASVATSPLKKSSKGTLEKNSSTKSADSVGAASSTSHSTSGTSVKQNSKKALKTDDHEDGEKEKDKSVKKQNSKKGLKAEEEDDAHKKHKHKKEKEK